VAIKYYPEDSGEGYGTLGIKFPMNANKAVSNSGGFNMSRTTEEQAVSNYINLLLTFPGERYMQPDYGIGIQRRLFEQNTELFRATIREDILFACNIWLPYIINDEIRINADEQIPGLAGNVEHGVRVEIMFRVTESGANRRITLFTADGIVKGLEVE